MRNPSEYCDLRDEEQHGTGEEGGSRLAQRSWGQREWLFAWAERWPAMDLLVRMGGERPGDC